jgi:diguanylate cyclase (GGDEF)-like protein
VRPASSRRAVARELAPFAVAALVAFALLPIGSTMQWAEYSVALALMVAALAGTVLTPWSALPPSARLVLPVAFLGAVALLRDAGGGTNSGVSILCLLPVFWVALHGTRLELGVLVAGVGAFFILPIVLVGEPAYPLTGLRTAALFMLVAGLVGLTVQRLVGEVRAKVAQGQRLAADREVLMAQLEHQALTDPLTGAGNRRAWNQWLELATADRRDEPFSIGVLDLDHFKAFNDEHGHGAGDALLAACAEAWLAELRPGDQLARMGGEEFAVLLPRTNLAGAVAVVRRLTGAMPGGQTCSGGVAQWNGIELDTALFRRADSALYAAKRSGRNRVEEAGENRFAPQPARARAASRLT